MTLASECLAAADAAVRDRRESYGSPQDNYARLSAFLSLRKVECFFVTPS